MASAEAVGRAAARSTGRKRGNLMAPGVGKTKCTAMDVKRWWNEGCDADAGSAASSGGWPCESLMQDGVSRQADVTKSQGVSRGLEVSTRDGDEQCGWIPRWAGPAGSCLDGASNVTGHGTWLGQGIAKCPKWRTFSGNERSRRRRRWLVESGINRRVKRRVLAEAVQRQEALL